MAFPHSFFEFMKANTLIGIKGGMDRDRFLNIWMVEVDHRVFARSWNKSEKSWFTAFQQTGVGQINYGGQILDVIGRKLDTDDPLQSSINQAYLKKYTQKENLSYARGISQPEYADYTMEFIVID